MNNNLLQVKNSEVVTDSLTVAESFKKNHRDVLRKIDHLISEITITQNCVLPLFEKSEYLREDGRAYPMYFMNRDGFSLLVMSFTGSEALAWKLKYIDAFNEMEKAINTPSADNRFNLAQLIATTPKNRLSLIEKLYPEYFSNLPDPNSLEYRADVNTAYTYWITDLGIDKDWISEMPTNEIYYNYLRYCQNAASSCCRYNRLG